MKKYRRNEGEMGRKGDGEICEKLLARICNPCLWKMVLSTDHRSALA